MRDYPLIPIPEVPYPLPGQPWGPAAVPEPSAFPLLASLLLVATAAVWRRRR